MAINEILALGIVTVIVFLVAIYESIMHRLMKTRLLEARESAASWKSLYRSVSEERDLLHRRLLSKDCQRVIAISSELDAAREEIKRLTEANDTYKKQIERNAKRKAASGSANTESCK